MEFHLDTMLMDLRVRLLLAPLPGGAGHAVAPAATKRPASQKAD